ncbi:MAG TPA: 2-phosphosulfolactate phosphatase [Longimicrobiales bacterium]|nr:2-phosphosulfolactate phosphatase [Longimicrobiales bacterium]
MRVEVAFTPAELAKGGTVGRSIVVIDVLRATSTIVQALVSGARRVIPVATVEEAVRKADELGRADVRLCGERDVAPIPGFDLGNSPEDFTAARVAGHTLVMSTTNGTRALLATNGAALCLVGALLNVGAIARRLAADGGDGLVLCSGREGRFALEDAYCAGLLVRALRQLRPGVHTDDGGRAALRLVGRGRDALPVLERTAAARRITERGLERDVRFCAQVDVHDVVPVFDGHRIELTSRE